VLGLVLGGTEDDDTQVAQGPKPPDFTGETYVCGDHSSDYFLALNEYSEYGEYAIHIDIETSMCDFETTPQVNFGRFSLSCV
jgi:hypothetical protein